MKDEGRHEKHLAGSSAKCPMRENKDDELTPFTLTDWEYCGMFLRYIEEFGTAVELEEIDLKTFSAAGAMARFAAQEIRRQMTHVGKASRRST